MIYIILFIYTIGAGYIFENSDLYKRRFLTHNFNALSYDSIKRFFLYILIVLPMVLVHSFRYGFGADYSGTYQALFYDVKNGIPLPNLEHGYYLLTKFVASFTDDYVWELFAASVLTFVIVLLAIYRNSSMLTVSLSMIFLSAFYFDSTNTVRQELAAAIFIYAVPYIKENKFWKYLACIFLASLFHTSVWLLLPLYFLSKFKINKKILFLVFFIVFLLRNQLNQLVINFVNTSSIYDKYENYLNDGRGTVLAYSIITGGILLIYIFFVKKNDKSKLDMWLIYLGFMFSILSAFVPYISRYVLYCLASLIFIVPDMFKNMNPQTKIIPEIMTYLLVGSYTIYIVFIGNWYHAIPYISFLNR